MRSTGLRELLARRAPQRWLVALGLLCFPPTGRWDRCAHVVLAWLEVLARASTQNRHGCHACTHARIQSRTHAYTARMHCTPTCVHLHGERMHSRGECRMVVCQTMLACRPACVPSVCVFSTVGSFVRPCWSVRLCRGHCKP